ncbi:MAG: hypothetical protein ACSHX9_05425 [Luteolibacter sp.]
MKNAYITSTGSFLPGDPIPNADIPAYMGELDGEADVRKKILRMNGITSRHYALDTNQNPTYDVYGMSSLAATRCLKNTDTGEITYLAAGSTNTPLIGPGISSILHGRLAEDRLITRDLEINSNSGICSASAQSLVNACRAIRCGEHNAALCIGVEQPSDILKSTAISPPDNRAEHVEKPTRSKWFMSVFLRSMLSDGAGAFLLRDKPSSTGISYQVNWTHSRSFANETPLCMSLDTRTLLLSQDVAILAEHLGPCVEKVIASAMTTNGDSISSYDIVLPHLSSFYFKNHMLGALEKYSGDKSPEHWTNLATSGNSGAASIYIMLDEFTRTRPPTHGQRILLFIPESGRFNFVVVSLTAIIDGQAL